MIRKIVYISFISFFLLMGAANAGADNTGGGAGGGGRPYGRSSGGSGIVMIRYKFQN